MASKKTGHHPQHQATFAIKRSLPQQIEQRRERGRMKPWKNTMNTYIPFEKQNRKHREQIEIEAFNRWNTFPWIFVTGQHAVSGASGAHQDPGMKFEHTQRGMLWYLGWVRNDAETWGANASHETSPGDNAFFWHKLLENSLILRSDLVHNICGHPKLSSGICWNTGNGIWHHAHDEGQDDPSTIGTTESKKITYPRSFLTLAKVACSNSKSKLAVGGQQSKSVVP